MSIFYTGEYARSGGIPTPFFSGVEDTHFLEVTLDDEMILYGID
jgi:hypothetical protein